MTPELTQILMLNIFSHFIDSTLYLEPPPYWEIQKYKDRKRIASVERLCKYMRNLRLATLISRTSVFPAIAYRVCAMWTKFFVIAHAENYMKAFEEIDSVFHP